MHRKAICNFLTGVIASGSHCVSGSIRIILFLFFCLVFFTGASQDLKKVDSLRAALESQLPHEQYGTLVQLVFEYVDRDNKLSLQYIDQARSIAFELGDSVKIVKSGRIKGQLLRRLDRLDEAMTLFTELMPIAKRQEMTSDYKLMLNSLAIAHTDRGDYFKALAYHFESLNLREAEGDKGEISISLDNIGRVYTLLRDYNKAIEYYERSIELKEQVEGDNGQYITLINLAYCYISLKNFERAREYFNEGLELCGKDCPEALIIDAEYGVGISYLDEGKMDDAKSHLSRSYKLAVATDNKRFQIENLYSLSKIATSNNEYDSALDKLTRAEKLSHDAGYSIQQMEIYRQFSTLYKKRNEFEKASFYQEKYITLKDSMFSENLIRNIASIQTKIEERENIKTIADKEEELIKQRKLNIAIIIIAVLATLLVFMLYRSNLNRRKANMRLDQEVKNATKDLQAANQLLAEVNQELDHFIYKTSHDIRGPLATLKGLCNVALTDVQDATALRYLNKLDFTATQLDTLLRRLQKINQINNAPVHSERIDFNEIVAHVETLEKRKGLPPRLTIEHQIADDIIYESDRELVTLILENLIANAIKFHDTSERVKPFVQIFVTQNDEEVVLRVVDNGIGIGETNPEELFHLFARASERSASGGIGLYLSRRATQKLGGEIDLHSTKEGHTEVIVSLPVRKTEPSLSEPVKSN